MGRKAWAPCGLCLLFVAALGGCASKTQTGALVGGLGGAAIGAGIGSISHGHQEEGALIGGSLGVVGGALVGRSLDRQARLAEEWSIADLPVHPAGATVSTDHVIQWNQQGIKDEVVVHRIEQSGSVFQLTAREENALRDQGVRESVIQAMKDTTRGPRVMAE